MTRTEERLADALRASAGRVRDDRMRPLPELWPGRAERPRRAWQGWLVPAAAAASVALVVGLALAVTAGPPWRPASGSPSGAGGPAAFPKYFAQLTGTNPVGGTVEVRSTSTGSMVASASSPRVGGRALLPDAMAAAPDGRTFYVSYDATLVSGSSVTRQIWIYRLSIADSALTRVKGGVIPGGGYGGVTRSMAVSPDGTKLALTAAGSRAGAGLPDSIDKIIVVDLRTGARSTWQGGLYRGGQTFMIPDVSWTADGRSIVFLGLWCPAALAANVCDSGSGPLGSREAQVRSVSVTAGGGSLDRGPVLLSPRTGFPVIADAVAGPRPGELTLVVLSGRTTTAGLWPKLAVERVSASTGAVLGVDYRTAPARYPPYITISSDPSGRYLLLSYGGRAGFRVGWIDHGKLRLLPIAQPFIDYPVTAW